MEESRKNYGRKVERRKERRMEYHKISYIPTAKGGVPKPEPQWTTDERKAAKLDQCLKSLIMSCLPEDLMDSLINCINYEERLINSVYEFKKRKTMSSATPLSISFFFKSIVHEFQDDLEDVGSSQECLDDLHEEFHERDLLVNSKRFFRKGPPRFNGASTSQSTQEKNKGLVAEAYE
ncbi:hypothetical protein Tco_0984487 [Tanacetum coccineum]